MLVTVDRLRQYMSGVSLTEDQWAAAEDVLAGVQAGLEEYLNRPVEPVLVREVVEADVSGWVRFSVTPVHSVRAVTGGSGIGAIPLGTPIVLEPLDTAGFTRVLNNVPGSLEAPLQSTGGFYTGFPGAMFVLEYVGGLLGYTDDDMVLQVMEVASRYMQTNHDDTMSIKDGLLRDPQPTDTPKYWSDEELVRFDRRRRRMVV